MYNLLSFKNKKYLILIFYIFLVVLASTIFAFKFTTYFPNIVNNNLIQLEKIPFNHGELIFNLLNNHGYKIKMHGIDYYLDRMPLVSFVAIIISKISINVYFFLILKNIIFFLIFFYTCDKIKHVFNNNLLFFFLLTHIIFFNFFNLQTTLNFVFEDAYISILLPSLFLILINEKIKYQAIHVSIFLLFLLFSKATTIYLAIAVSALFLIISKDKLIYRFYPIIFLIIGMLVWGVFGFSKTGRIPFLNSMLSSNHIGLALVFNEKFKHIYPKQIIDVLVDEKLGLYPPLNKDIPRFKNEWEYHDYFKEKNIKFLRENKLEILTGVGLKLNFLFFNVYNYGATENVNENKTKILISHFLNRIVFMLCLLFLFLKIIKKNITREDIYFATIITTTLLPFIIAWITSKHLVPIFIICHIYFLLNIYKIFYKK